MNKILPVIVDTKENLENSTKIIPDGMIVKEIHSGQIKIGDGIHTYLELEFIGSGIDASNLTDEQKNALIEALFPLNDKDPDKAIFQTIEGKYEAKPIPGIPSGGKVGQTVIMQDNGSTKWDSVRPPFNQSIGEQIFTLNSEAPIGTIFNDGQLVSKTEYQELYDLIGDSYNDSFRLNSMLLVPVISDTAIASNPDITSYSSVATSDIWAIIKGNIKLTTSGASGGTYDANYMPSNAFNSLTTANANGCWLSRNATMPVSFMIEFLDGTKYALHNYSFLSGSALYGFQNWTLSGSNNGTTWVTLDTRTAQTIGLTATNYRLNNNGNPMPDGWDYTYHGYFSKFKFNFTKATGSYGIISTMRIYGTKEGEISITDGFALPPASYNGTARSAIAYQKSDHNVYLNVGAILVSATEDAPSSHTVKAGQNLKKTAYPKLYTLYENTYNDGTTQADEFKLPTIELESGTTAWIQYEESKSFSTKGISKGFSFEQSSPAKIWEIQHPGNSKKAIVTCYNENGEQIIGNVSIVNNSYIEIRYCDAVKGTAIITFIN